MRTPTEIASRTSVAAIHTADIAEAIGIEPLCAYKAGPAIGSPVVEVADEQTVRCLTP